ncbi:MAG: outer membrane beta-barrel protein [bacterium]
MWKIRTIVLVIFLPCIILAQRNTAGFKLGMYSPEASETGFIIGFETGRYVDRFLDIGFSIDWFNKNYVDESLIEQFDEYYGGPGGTINEVRAKTNLHDIPVMFNATGYFPVGPRVNFYVTGGIGAEVLLIWYRNFEQPNDDEFKAAFDFNWRVGTGISYELGHRSDLFAEIAYHNSEPSWTYEVDSYAGHSKRVFERKFDMSGVMFRVGVKFYY